MILRKTDSLKPGMILERDVKNEKSVLFSSGKELSEETIQKIKSLGIPFVYISGEPTEKDIVVRALTELESGSSDGTESDRIETLIRLKVSPEKLIPFFQKIGNSAIRLKFLDYIDSCFSDQVFNFLIKTVRFTDDISVREKIYEIINGKINSENVYSILTLLETGDRMVEERIKKIVRKNFSLRKLREIADELKKRGKESDFFKKEINFSVMPPKYFWDLNVLVVSGTENEHSILKTYLENLEMKVKWIDRCEFDSKIEELPAEVIFYDLDNFDPSDFIKTASRNSDRLYLVFSSKIDRKIFWDVINSGASYFIKKPYSLPKIQSYLSSALRNGRKISTISSSDEKLKVDVRQFSGKVRKFDFYGELTSYTTRETEDNVYSHFNFGYYYFFDLSNLLKIDSSGMRFFLESHDKTKKMDSDLIFCNSSAAIYKEMTLFAGKLNMVEKWEEYLWK